MEVTRSSSYPRGTDWEILIIDNDQEDYILAREMLKEAKGHTSSLHWAATFEQGREALRSTQYSAVLVDYDLGLHSGIDLIREASQNGYGAPLILFTGRGSYEVDVEAMQAGATLYLTKSEANPRLLERIIRYAIELKQKEQALRDSEAKERARLAEMDAILEAVPAIVWVAHDPQGWDVTGNRAGHEFLRVPAGNNLSKTSPQDAPRNFKVYKDGKEIAPEELPLQRSAATGLPLRNFEEDVVFDDGSQAHLLGNVTPLLDEAGRPRGAVAAFIDITERRNIEEALRLSEERFHKAFNASPNAKVISGLENGRIEVINHSFERLFGYPREEIIGRTSLELNMFANPSDRAEAVRRMLAEGFVRDFEIDIRRKNGETVCASLSTEFIEIDGQRKILTVITDITERKRAEEALRQSETRMRGLFDAMQEVFFVCEVLRDTAGQPVDLRYLDVNAACCQRARRTRDEMVGHTYLELFPDNPTFHQWLAQFDRVSETGEPANFEQFAEATGLYFIVNAYRPQPGQCAALLTDISERRRAEQDRRESEDRLRDFMENTHDIFLVLDRGWRFQYVNRRCAEILGKAPDELVEMVIWDAFPRYLGTKIEQQCRSVMAERVPVDFETGEVYPGAWHSISIYPAREGIAIFAADRTKEKQASQALRLNENRLRRLFDTSVIGIVMRDPQGTVLEANDAFLDMIGYSQADLHGGRLSIARIMAPEYLEIDRQAIEQALASGANQPYEKVYLHKDGRRVPVLVGHTRLDSERTEIVGYVVPLGELKAAQEALERYTEKLQRSNQELEQFAFVASHDLQEPLRKINMFGELLRKHLASGLDDQSADFLERMQSAAARMQAMIAGLLDLSRVSTRGREFSRVNLQALLKDVVSDLEPRIEAVGGQVDVGDLPEIEADELQIRRLFLNLVGNAIKFHRPGVPPRVQVTGAESQEGETQVVVLKVSDNGIGFEPGSADEIFRPFQRLHGRSEYEGTGLGLAICQKIVERHAGKIEVSSTPAQGSTFTVTLPARKQD